MRSGDRPRAAARLRDRGHGAWLHDRELPAVRVRPGRERRGHAANLRAARVACGTAREAWEEVPAHPDPSPGSSSSRSARPAWCRWPTGCAPIWNPKLIIVATDVPVDLDRRRAHDRGRVMRRGLRPRLASGAKGAGLVAHRGARAGQRGGATNWRLRADTVKGKSITETALAHQFPAFHPRGRQPANGASVWSPSPRLRRSGWRGRRTRACAWHRLTTASYANACAGMGWWRMVGRAAVLPSTCPMR